MNVGARVVRRLITRHIQWQGNGHFSKRTQILCKSNRHMCTSRAVPLAHSVFDQTGGTDPGGPPNPPLLLIHGMFGSKRNWEGIAKQLSRSYKVITVDCRNHGDSPHVQEMGYHLMAEDIELLMNNLGIKEAVILGHSMGGKVAMTFALTNPDLVSKLIVEDVSPDVSRNSALSRFPSFIMAMRGLQFDHTVSMPQMRKIAAEHLKNIITDKGELDFLLTNLVEKDGQYSWTVNLTAIYEYLDDLLGFPDSSKVFEKDTLFIAGSESDLIREKHHSMISRFFKQAKVQTLQGAGHWVHAERPNEFIKMVMDFCRS